MAWVTCTGLLTLAKGVTQDSGRVVRGMQVPREGLGTNLFYPISLIIISITIYIIETKNIVFLLWKI